MPTKARSASKEKAPPGEGKQPPVAAEVNKDTAIHDPNTGPAKQHTNHQDNKHADGMDTRRKTRTNKSMTRTTKTNR